MVRIKHRYLLVNILYPEEAPTVKSGKAQSEKDVPYTVQFRQPSPENMNGKVLSRTIRDQISYLFGDYGSGTTSGSLQVKYFSPATSTAIIRVAREHYRLVWAALTFVTKLPRPVDRACVMQVVRVSGTIKKAEEEAIRRAKATIKRATRATRKLDGTGHAHVPGNLGSNEIHDDGEDDRLIGASIEDPDDSDDQDEDD